ncbi:hypothetical protein OTK51_19190 [Vibrio scophthalmi]|uniref:hypothetical protein n=1 Tax=Vibrio scophthalmi TaxID=45658 RepID=UPI002284A766|nr:hypothetical protein [Vibrio scophthalmi]MCY9805553.1 hypothetical protein [Vibrio scophthalmi]
MKFSLANSLYLLCVSFYSNNAFSFNTPKPWPETHVVITAKYDPFSEELYDINVNGNERNVEVDILNDTELKVTHGRDIYRGKTLSNGTPFYLVEDTTLDPDEILLSQGMNSDVLAVKFGTGNSVLALPPHKSGRGTEINMSCRIDGGPRNNNTEWFWGTSSINKSGDVYSKHKCQSLTANSFNNQTIGGYSTYIERYFKVDSLRAKNIPFGMYSGSYRTSPGKYGYDKSGEVMRYTINIELLPNINNFSVDNDNIVFSVNKQSNQIVGKVQTGFNVIGSFHNSQAFDMTFNSANSVLCGGALCLSNTSAGTTIPYTTKVFDPATLQEKPVSRSGQKVTVYADQDYRLSGGLFFEFDTDNTALSGTFNDILTVRVELKLI